MRLNFRTLVLASAALATASLAALPAMAATSSTTLNVPFSFTVDGHSLPAGTYSVQRDDAGTFVRLQGKDASQRFTWVAAASANRGDRAVLKFAGQAHHLQSVQFGPLVTTTLDRKTRKSEDITPQDVPGL